MTKKHTNTNTNMIAPDVLTKRLSSDFEGTVNTVATGDLLEFVRLCNDRYYNTGTPVVTDEVFDRLKDHLETVVPNAPVLQEIGCDVPVTTGCHEKVTLPYWMGSMDKVKTQPDLQKWLGKNPSSQYVVTDKLDGVSALFVVDTRSGGGGGGGGRRRAEYKLYTRGNGREGHDISDMIPSINGLREFASEPSSTHHDEATTDNVFVVRGELVISKKAFSKLVDSEVVKVTSNARNTVSGAVNAKQRTIPILRSIDFVAYELIDRDGVQSRPSSDQLRVLSKVFGPTYVVNNVVASASNLVRDVESVLAHRREHGAYDVDGLVITSDLPHTRNQAGNPKYATAFKMNIETRTVVVRDVEWNLSKDGYLKPIVWFEPVVIGNVTIRKATGFNAKFVEDHSIGKEARIVITRSGDVIPFITSVVEPAQRPQMPTSVAYEWNETHVDIRVVIPDNADTCCDGTTLFLLKRKQFEHLVSKLDVRGLGKSLVHKLFDHGIDDLTKLLNVDTEDLKKIDGVREKSARNIRDAIDTAKQKITYESILVASNIFGRGIGPKTVAAVLHHYPDLFSTNQELTVEDLNRIDGFDSKTSSSFVRNMSTFRKYLLDHNLHGLCRSNEMSMRTNTTSNVTDSVLPLTNQVFVFSGTRDKQLMQRIASLGGVVENNLSSKVTCLVMDDMSMNSSKKQLALKKGIKIVDKTDAMFLSKSMP